MTDSDAYNASSNITDDEQPIALRRKRRSSTGLSSCAPSKSNTKMPVPHGITTPPATPKRSKKRVRFSDPGPSLDHESTSSGLTPFICRTTLTTPTSKRRHSTPSRFWNLADHDTPISGTIQFEPLRQVLDGRVKRRIKRNRLSEEVNAIVGDKRHEAKARKSEIDSLKQQLAAKDLEVQLLRDDQDIASQLEEESGTSPTIDETQGAQARDLEQQIQKLKAKLKQREVAVEAGDPDWTFAARDPFNFDEDDDDEMMMTSYDHDFTMTNDELMTTPTQLHTSFPSPPSTTPNTPCKSASCSRVDVGVQAFLSIPDPEIASLQEQLVSLQSEVTKLNSTIALKDDDTSRLAGKLSDFLPVDESDNHSAVDSALDSVLTKLALSQAHAFEEGFAYSALSTEITNLGFGTSGPEETLEKIAHQFRQARLELEYATPGEVAEGFANSKLLDMLVSRVQVLVKKIKERDDSIDQYHEQEVSLRQQLNTRVDAQQDVQKELCAANSVVQTLQVEINEKEASNVRLQRALVGYRAEVKNLETLIESLEEESKEKGDVMKDQVRELEDTLQDEVLRHDTTRASDEGKEMMLIQLEQRLNAALTAAAEVQNQMTALASSSAATIAGQDATISRLHAASASHGEALALRDARVGELRMELERVNEALKMAHSTILSLRQDNAGLEAQAEGERTRGEFVVQAMREQLNRVLETGMGYINGDVSVQRSVREGSAPPAIGGSESQAVVRRGRFLDSGLARRSSGKRRRRHDSGLDFLEEGDEDVVSIGAEV